MRSSDWPSVSLIYSLGIATGCATFQQTVPDYDDWAVSHPERGRYVLVDSRDDESILGWIALSPVSSRAVYAGVMELSVYVHPDYQGLGIGTQLLHYILSHATELGIWTLQSTIIRENDASLRLHQQCGFRQVGYRERVAQDVHGIWRDTIIFEKRL